VYKEKKIFAIITARGGSKGLPRKNVKMLCGKPLIAWTIEQANKSKYVDDVIVSTDDKEIAKIANEYAAEVPFLRPEKVSLDTSKSIDVVLHAIEWLQDNDRQYDLLVMLQPTSPLRLAQDIDGAIELLLRKKAESVVSVCPSEHPMGWTNVLSKNGSMRSFLKKDLVNSIRQELPQSYSLNGAVYVSFCDILKEKLSFIHEGTFAYIMPRVRSVDIDDEYDFKLAEFIMKEGIGLHNDKQKK